MRNLAALLLALLGINSALTTRAQTAPACTGLCLQQVTCPAGTPTTTLTGTVFAPNGTDPLPNVLVYIPNAAVDAFTPGVSCPVVGQVPSGSPLVGTTTAVDGTFTLTNVPVGTSIPLVLVSGRWRRQIVIPSTTACANTIADPTLTRFPRTSAEGDIPKFAIATGAVDSVECVLRKVGIADSEFTDPSGTGRINIYAGSGAPGAVIDASTPSETVLMSNTSTLNSYDVLMLPCEGSTYPNVKNAAEYANLITFANSGGRVYSSHFSYQWMYQNPPFNTVANWIGSSTTLPDGIATVNPSFSASATLAQWLQLVGASTTLGQIPISTIKHDFNGVNAPTEAWLNLNNSAAGNPVMQMVFDTPVGAAGAQCGRVLFNEYHVETPVGTRTFPGECASGTTLNPQEKLLEYSLFELTDDGSNATLNPTSQDFGTEAVGFNSAPQTFTWTNKSTFSATVSPVTATGDFNITANTCKTVLAGASCQITVVFNPTALGARTGILSVGSSGGTLTAALTGNGVPALVFNLTSLTFGSQDVGAAVTQTLQVTNTASGSVPFPALVTTGDFSTSNNCGSALAAGQSCTVSVTFKPSISGPRTGTLAVNSTSAAYSNDTASLTGNGIDFTVVATPTSGSVISGYTTRLSVLTSPLAGFANPVTLTCTTSAPGSTCSVSPGTFTPASPVTSAISITTTSQYTVIGYGGLGGPGLLSLAGIATGLLLWLTRRRTSTLARATLVLIFAVASTLTGCSGKQPAQNANYTAVGSYTYTLTATDGFLVHSATYALNVTKN